MKIYSRSRIIIALMLGSISLLHMGCGDENGCQTGVPLPVPFAIPIGLFGGYNCMPAGLTTAGPYEVITADMGKLKVTVTGQNWKHQFNLTTVFTHDATLPATLTGVVTKGAGTQSLNAHKLSSAFDRNCLIVERPIQADQTSVGGVSSICGETEIDIAAWVIQGGSNSCPTQAGGFCLRWTKMKTVTLDQSLPKACADIPSGATPTSIDVQDPNAFWGSCN
jgi:hypothetical protein